MIFVAASAIDPATDWPTFYLGLGTAVLAFIGFLVGLWRYSEAQKWRRSEFAAAQLEKLSSDPDLAFCCALMDWSPRLMIVPAGYVPFIKSVEFRHEWMALYQALSKPEQADFGWIDVLYRDKFDIFFTYLERLDHYLRIGLISQADVSSLSYWAQKIGSTRVTEAGPLVYKVFVMRYYPSIEFLMKRFNVDWHPVTLEQLELQD